MDTSLPVPDLAAYLTGTWRLTRDIVTTGGADAGAVTGTATFTPAEDVLIYDEEGELRLGGFVGPVTRTLHYRLARPERADVHFDHGGFFHDLDLSTGRWSTEHPCRADRYHGEFHILDDGHWRQEWTVTGPAKDHVIVSRFARL
ncbi:DUF6314 family protein [Amycolatopsis sp. NPDC059021]|uniref:DUF6314 family protein n=1 Tax=Amycolatopsis sp. NPDC059021 TaxID=3346704 RepID=UPI00366F6CE8